METNTWKSDFLKEDPAIKSFLSKSPEEKNEQGKFQDYPPTMSLVRAAVDDVMDALGMKR